MGVYMSQALPTPADAHRILDDHPISAADGRCVRCRVEGCHLRTVALEALARHGMLPRRRCGATRPELIGARRVGWRG